TMHSHRGRKTPIMSAFPHGRRPTDLWTRSRVGEFCLGVLDAGLGGSLRPPDAVEPRGIIVVARIAEIERAVGQRATLHRHPRSSGSSGGFNHERNICSAGVIESKVALLHPKTAATTRHHRVPEHRRPAAEGGTPTGRARQVIDDD